MSRRLLQAQTLLVTALVIWRAWRVSRKHGIPMLDLLRAVNDDLREEAAALQHELYALRYTRQRAGDVN